MPFVVGTVRLWGGAPGHPENYAEDVLQMGPEQEAANAANEAVAASFVMPLDDKGLPPAAAWETARAVTFCSDWLGLHIDTQRKTEVRLLWSPALLFLRFRARYREIYVFPETNCRRHELWLRDVAEVFLQPDPSEARRYKEFEVSPNGSWLDLDIAPGRTSPLSCDLTSRVAVDGADHVWTAELAIPMNCLTREFDPEKDWRVNFFRVEGPEPNRFYSAWRPTHTPQPNFHVPEVFGKLAFACE